MPRRKRIWYPGAIYHVMSRGNRRTTIFKEKSDYYQFLEFVKKVKDKYPFTIHALCLMTNHFHFLIETGDIELSKFMQKILSLYAMDFNKRYDLTGHLFESRYTACLVESDKYFLEVSRYIHLNPVKAQIVTDPYLYDYSSYRFYIDSGAPEEQSETDQIISDLLTKDKILGMIGNGLSTSENRYRNFVEDNISHSDQEHLIQKDIREDDMWLPV